MGHRFLGLEVENLPLGKGVIFLRPSHQLDAGVDIHRGRLARDHGDLTPGNLQRVIALRKQADPVLARRQGREAPALLNMGHRFLGLEVENLPLGKGGICFRPSHQLDAGVDIHRGRLARDHGDLTPGNLQRVIALRKQADPVLARRQGREAPALLNMGHRFLGLEVENLPLGKGLIFLRPPRQLDAGVDIQPGRLARGHGDLTPGNFQRMPTHREQADPVLARRQRSEAPASVHGGDVFSWSWHPPHARPAAAVFSRPADQLDPRVHGFLILRRGGKSTQAEEK